MSGAHRRTSRASLVLLQLLVFVTYIFGPTATFAEDPLPEPTPTESVAPAPSSEPIPELTVDPSVATAIPTPSDPEPSIAPSEPAPSDPAPSDPAPSAPDSTTSPEPASLPYLITFAPGTGEARQLEILGSAGATDVRAIPQLAMRSILLQDSGFLAQLDQLRANVEVARVEADRTRDVEAAPSDSSYPDQWSLPQIGWDQLYRTAGIAGSATVAVLDTGVDGSHPDLDGVLLSGTSVLDGSNGLIDPNGHGTWMAGIVAAETDNGYGIAGTAYAGVSVLPVTVLGADGTGQDSDIIAGVVYAADAGADVILMSFSNPGYSAALQAAIDYAWASGAVLVAATGNDGSSAATFPAGDRGVIGVASTDEADALAASSNYGAAAFMAAPGVDIATTSAGGAVATISGTSAAAAQVAGAAALLQANEPSVSNGVIVSRLARNADPTLSTGTGNGRLNLARAMADTSTDSVQPAGAAPIAGGGPLVGPYVAAGNGTVTGTVRDAVTLAPISGATVTCSTAGTNPCNNTATTTTSATGTYTLSVEFQGNSGTVRITASKAGYTGSSQGVSFTANNQTRTANFSLTPSNSAPSVAKSNASVTVAEGQTATNTGTYSDADTAQNVSITASVGIVTKTGTSSGTWSWSYATTDGPNQSQTVTITANDGAGGTATTTFSLTVINVAPSIAISGAPSVNEGASYSLTLGAVTDPGSDTVTSYIVHWGDSSSSTYSTAGVKTHTYADGPNSHAITVDLVDEDGTHLDRANVLSVSVLNLAPSIAISGAASVNEGSPYSLTLGAVADPGSDTVSSYIVHWGDSSSSTYSTNGVKTHTYADGPATRAITVDLVDEDGTHLDRANAVSVTVNNVAPATASPTFTYDSVSGIATAGFTFSDPGWLDNHSSTFTWTIDGSPTVVNGTDVEEHVAPDSTGSSTSTFDMPPGCHTITVTGRIDDHDGGVTTQPIVTGMSSVDVYLATFDAPIKENERNIARYGNVVPVKVRLASSCTGVATNAPNLYITVAQGVTTETFGDEVIVTSSNNADSGTQMMRTPDTKYMYNLSTKGFEANTNYEVRIRVGSTTGPIIAKAVLYPKK